MRSDAQVLIRTFIRSRPTWARRCGRRAFVTTSVLITASLMASGEASSRDPVAVLMGPHTVSAGEVLALAFVGRPNTRFFGEPTAGLTTANKSYPLFDGTLLALSVAAMTDRFGTTHLHGVQPDEVIATDWTDYGTFADPVLIAAREWLSQQPACSAMTGES